MHTNLSFGQHGVYMILKISNNVHNTVYVGMYGWQEERTISVEKCDSHKIFSIDQIRWVKQLWTVYETNLYPKIPVWHFSDVFQRLLLNDRFSLTAAAFKVDGLHTDR